MMTRIKVLFILPSSIGGAERVTVTIAKFLDRERYDVKFVVLTSSKGEKQSLIPEGYDVHYVKLRNIWDFTVTRLTRLFRKERPQFVFSSLRYINVRVLAAAKLAGGVKAIVRNDNGLQTARWDNRLLMRLTYRYAHLIIAQQEEMRQELIDVMHLSPEKIVAIPNPLNTDIIDQKAQEPSPFPEAHQVNYLWAARFFYNKGQDLLCRAFRLVSERQPDAHLYLIGRYDTSDAYFQQVRQYVETNHLEEKVHFIGEASNPFKYMRHCDCFVMPSRYEGLPNALVEAMYLGRPVVATRCIPMISRIVSDHYNGILVAPDDEQQMAEAMISALSLHDFKMTFQPSRPEDFTKLFPIEP